MTSNTSLPLASTLTLLTYLPQHPVGMKVRFLGCVTRYDVRKGVLELQHPYPHPSTSSIPRPAHLELSRPARARRDQTDDAAGEAVLARVDINVIKDTLENREVFDVGTWVNVVGYINPTSTHPSTSSPETDYTTTGTETRNNTRNKNRHTDGDGDVNVKLITVAVDAVLLWSAGAVKLQEYERAVEGRLAIASTYTSTSTSRGPEKDVKK